MSEIKVGDLVMVVKLAKCCSSPHRMGKVYTVSGFFPSGRCGACGKSEISPCALLDGKWEACELYRLKKIDPPALPESVTEREELTA